MKKNISYFNQINFYDATLKNALYIFCFDIYSFLKERAKIVWYSFRRASKELT